MSVTAACRPHSTPKPLSWQEGAVAALTLLLLTVICFWPQVIAGRVLYWGDIGLYFTPMTAFLHANLRAGRWPLWNPLIMCGAPYVGNPQTWPLYPFSFFLRWLPAPQFLNLTIAFHVWLAGVGTYALARRTLPVGIGAALLAAITFMFGGQLVSKEQFPNMVQAAAYLPLILLLLDRLLDRRAVRDAFCLGAALGLQLLAAHAQMTLLTLYLALVYGVFVFIQRRRNQQDTEGRRVCGLLALTFGVAAGLAAGQLLPTAELLRDAYRQRLSFHLVNRFFLPYDQITNFLLPYRHGDPFHSRYIDAGLRRIPKATNYWEACCYVGILPCIAAIIGVAAAWRRGGAGIARFWSLVFLGGLVMALGGGGGLYHLAYWVLPGFRSFHDPARCLLWAVFALAMLSAYGLQALLDRLRWPRARLVLTLAVVLLAFVDLAHFDRGLYPLTSPAALFPVTPNVAALQRDAAMQAHQARYLTGEKVWAWQRFTSYLSFRQSMPGYQRLWTDTLTPNLMMPYGLSSAYGYEPVARSDTMLASTHARESAAWAGSLGVRYEVFSPDQSARRPMEGLTLLRVDASAPLLDAPRTGNDRVFLFRNDDWQPRARLMTDYVSVSTPQQALTRMTRAVGDPRRLDLRRTVVIAGAVPFPARLSGLPRAALLTADSPDRVAIRAVTTAPTLLVLADTFSPGWRAVLDGHPVPILAANSCLRAVPLPSPGRHSVIFTYKPTSVLLGLYMTLLTVAILTAALVSAILSHRMDQENDLT